MEILIIILGILGGASVGIQSPIVTGMGKRIGNTASSFMVHASGTALSGLLLLMRGGENIRDWSKLPWYMLGSGAFGLVLYLTLNQTLPRLGATTAASLIVIGQLLAGMIVDHFGWFEVAQRSIDGPRILAVILLAAGGYLMVR